ncbi:hypothetical protein VaNZ11_009797 [Volvox africanus]|uniref:TFIIS N-terminal domain-containing protein n=1 Tax=Volvox africanus TaxID=51714 RepID=A0ABQ5S824_9CHLO|nr:hypothetical protein VaNZ11_009797 [Volvox africanus]
MNEQDFLSATVDMEDTALWDVRRIALQAARRDDATPVRYFEDAVTENLRLLHRLSQESLWDELQKHELGKRTLRALAAEYKPARMVAFEPDDLRKASIRFWEALRTEDEGVREALAAYDYGAVVEQLAKLSVTLDREVLRRLVYINCPRQNVVEEVVGTIQLCTTNELKMLASKLFDRLDKTGSLSDENREMGKKLPHCKSKEDLRVAVRDLLRIFKRKPPPDEPSPPSNIIGPSVATVTVSYKGQQRQVAAVVRIERLDKIFPEEPKVEVAPPPLPRPPSPRPSEPVDAQAKAQAGADEGGSQSGSRENSVVTVGSDRTIPVSTLNARHDIETEGLGQGGVGSPAVHSKAPSKVPSVVGVATPKEATPAGSVVNGAAGWPTSVSHDDTLPPLTSPKGTPPGSTYGGALGLSDIVKGAPSPRPSNTGSVVGVVAAAASDLAKSTPHGSVVGSNTGKVTPAASVVGARRASDTKGPGSDAGSVRAAGAHPSSKTTPAGSVVNGVSPMRGSDFGGSVKGSASSKTTPAGSVLGVPPALGSDVGSVKSTPAHKPSSVISSVYPATGAVTAPSGPGSEVGSTRSALTQKTTPAGSVVGGTAAAAPAGSVRSARTTPAGSVVGAPAAAAPAGSVPGIVVGVGQSGPGSVKSVSSGSQSSQSTLAASDTSRQNTGGLGHHAYGSISFDHQGMTLSTPKPLTSDVEDQPRTDPWEAVNDDADDRVGSPGNAPSPRSSRVPSRTGSVASRKSLVPTPRADSISSSRQLEAF